MRRVQTHLRWLDLVVAALLVFPLLITGMGRALGLSQRARVPASAPNPRVAIVHASEPPSDAAVETMVRQGLDLALGSGGISQVVSTGDTVLLKVNLGTGLDVQEITSWQVARAVALACQEAGAARVIVAEGPELGMEHYAQAGYVAHLTGVEYLDFNAASTSLAPVQVAAPLWASGQELVMPRVYLDADVVISVPKMKTHNVAGVTVSMKNAVGVPPVAAYRSAPDRTWRDLFHSQYGIHKTIVQINQARKPDLAVVDAIVSGEGNGPWGASAVQTNMIFVSRDPVAADAVATASMGFDPERVRHLVYAKFKGLGQMDLEQIEVVGASLDSVRRSFTSPSNVPRLFRRTTTLGGPPQGLVLDGNVAEWAGGSGLWIRRPTEVQAGAAAWSGEADASMHAWAGYDQGALYVAARVWDDQVRSNDRTASSIWNGDALELYISGAAQDQSGRESTYLADDFRLGIGYGQATLVDIGRGQIVPGATAAILALADGYSLEARIPFSSLHGLSPMLNREIGLDLALDDADGTASRESLLVWSGTANVSSDVREMGIALLTSDEAAPETATPTGTATIKPTAPSTAAATPSHTRSLTPSSTGTPGACTATPTVRPSAAMTASPAPTPPPVRLPLVMRGKTSG